MDWINPTRLVEDELRQLQEAGADVHSARSAWEGLLASKPEDLERQATEFLDELEKSFHNGRREEPSTWEEIQSERSPDAQTAPVTPDPERVALSVRGGWFGRAAGCLLGKPVEMIPREGIRELLMSNATWPLSNYITGLGIPDGVAAKHSWDRRSRLDSLRENIVCMTEDDDMNYPMLNLHVLETHGFGFTTEDIGGAWLEMLPVFSTFTAERMAYRNLLNGIRPPRTASTHNPYREWIGAQIRADMWGWVSPADPVSATRLAYEDARLSHTANGIYGEMFVAAAIASAFVCETPGEVIERALKFVPRYSRLYEAIDYASALPSVEPDWERGFDRLYRRYGHYHWVHTINNAALVTAALAYGKGDYGNSICIAVMGGWDTDCNGATVGSILGTLGGIDRIPAGWVAPLNNRIRSSLKGFDNTALSDLAARTTRIALDHALVRPTA